MNRWTNRRPRIAPLSSPQPPAAPAAPAAAAAPPLGEPSTASQFLTVFPPIMLPMFLAVADQTIVATALPTIASNLGEIERASWVVVSYLIANTIAAPVYGRLGDTFGRRLMMFVALAIFMLGSVLCALAPNIELAHRVPRAARVRRRRPDDLVAGADRRGDPAARARPLSRLPCRRRGQFQHLRAGRRRLFDPGLRLAIHLPHQHSARTACLYVRVSHSVAPGRPPPHHLRFAGPDPVHPFRRAGHLGARAGAAHGNEHAADGAGAARFRAGRARPAGFGRSGSPPPRSFRPACSGRPRSGAPTPWRPATARRWCR